MKRILIAFAILLPCFFLVGCGSDSRAGYIKDTIGLIDGATDKIKVITTKVTDAVKKAEGKKIDLTEAMEATDGLKKVGAEAQELKRRIDKVRLQVTDEDRKKYANEEKDNLSQAFVSLLKARSELKLELAKAEEANPNNKLVVKELRAKIEDAESPFEAIARH
jgi:type II secretory pathway component PulF